LDEILKTKADSSVFSKVFEVGARFHEQIVACSGNAFFTEAVQHINRLRRLIEYNFKIDEPRLGRYREHLEILDFLESGHNQEVADLLRHHLNQAKINRRPKA
jgi:DNA-binding GntR family transcriptional regulator